MLFALDWMKRTWAMMLSAIRTLTEGLDLFSVSEAIREYDQVVIVCSIAGIIFCFLGFRYHKFVHGLIGGILLGALGWHLGQGINAEQISVSAVYTVVLAIVGFFVLYMCYFLNVFVGGCFLFLAVLAPCRLALQNYIFLLAVLSATIYCVIYIKYKMVMTAVTGAVMLGLVFFYSSPVISAVIAFGCTAAGIYAQLVLQHRYEEKKRLSMQEQLEKYPYGPGLVYGWQDPTLSHSSKKQG